MDTDTCTDVATFSSAVSGVVLSFGRHGHWFRRRPNGKRRFMHMHMRAVHCLDTQRPPGPLSPHPRAQSAGSAEGLGTSINVGWNTKGRSKPGDAEYRAVWREILMPVSDRREIEPVVHERARAVHTSWAGCKTRTCASRLGVRAGGT